MRVLTSVSALKQIRIFNHLDYIISRIMLTTFLITGVLLSCSVVQCLYFDLTPAEKAGLVMFFTGTPLELALCCYFADRFMVKTDQLVNVIYNMNWYEQGPEFRKMVIIFMEMNQNKKVILAGNLKEVNLAACMDIFKFTYTLIAFVLQMSG
ncbi:odorant receptor 2a-like [Hermetia illucens]|uniref:odorant receptor 2a-like n=1 Tax=Hermetia illucens TaxID=343691 RepID=UPI0018CC66E5|nr:odorant receptor 2a-like [Hermetia illucens]